MQQFELPQTQAGDAPVSGMFDFAILAIGGADEADRIAAGALNLEMEGKRFSFNGH